jgi:hypothetical protein
VPLWLSGKNIFKLRHYRLFQKKALLNRIKKVQESFRRSLLNNKVSRQILNENFKRKFPSSALYWETRYRKNGTSGNGSYGDIAIYKASILNKFVAENEITKVIEFGCGDGNQLKLLKFPIYIGLDVSATAIEKCLHIFRNDRTKSFFIYHHRAFADNLQLFKAEMAVSLDVIYHLLEDEIYENYMQQLFTSASRFVILYAWDTEEKQKGHVRHRKFSEWIARNIKDWRLLRRIENTAAPTCDFFIYEKDA